MEHRSRKKCEDIGGQSFKPTISMAKKKKKMLRSLVYRSRANASKKEAAEWATKREEEADFCSRARRLLVCLRRRCFQTPKREIKKRRGSSPLIQFLSLMSAEQRFFILSVYLHAPPPRPAAAAAADATCRELQQTSGVQNPKRAAFGSQPADDGF